MAFTPVIDPVTAAPDDQHLLGMLDDVLQAEQPSVPKLLGPNGEEIDLPESLFYLLRQMVHDMSQGRTVMLVSRNQMLTTQQAADILNVSRPYLVKLLEEQRIPFIKTGKHRRITFEDLMVYKHKRDAQRRQALAELTRLGEDMGDYD
jgi:excisionase family DNA binding protein